MLRAQCLLVPSKRSHLRLLRILHLALISVEQAEVVDRVHSGRLLPSQCIIFPSQRLHAHFFRLLQLAWSIVDQVEAEEICAPCLTLYFPKPHKRSHAGSTPLLANFPIVAWKTRIDKAQFSGPAISPIVVTILQPLAHVGKTFTLFANDLHHSTAGCCLRLCTTL